MPPRSSEQRQNRRERQSEHEKRSDADRRGIGVLMAAGGQVVQDVDGSDKQNQDHPGNDSHDQALYPASGIVDLRAVCLSLGLFRTKDVLTLFSRGQLAESWQVSYLDRTTIEGFQHMLNDIVKPRVFPSTA